MLKGKGARYFAYLIGSGSSAGRHFRKYKLATKDAGRE